MWKLIFGACLAVTLVTWSGATTIAGSVTSIRDDCPVELVPLCTWPQVREILALKEQANVAGIETEAQEKLVGRQIEIVGELQDLGALRAVAEYLVRESSKIGNWGFALALSNLSAARALAIFKNVADPVPEGDAFDTVKLIELQLGFGTKSTARLAFDAHARYVSDKYGGFLAVFVMAEVGLALSQAGFSQPARAYFAQADDVARLLPTNGDPLKYPRMMSFLQFAQRTADAGFAKLARAHLDKAKALKLTNHSEDQELEKVLQAYEKYLAQKSAN